MNVPLQISLQKPGSAGLKSATALSLSHLTLRFVTTGTFIHSDPLLSKCRDRVTPGDGGRQAQRQPRERGNTILKSFPFIFQGFFADPDPAAVESNKEKTRKF